MCGAFHEKRLSPWGALSGGSTGGIEGSWSAHGPSSGSFSSAIGLERPFTVGLGLLRFRRILWFPPAIRLDWSLLWFSQLEL